MRRLFLVVIVLGFASITGSCGAASRHAVADFCAAINVHKPEDEALFDLLDEFARDQQLVPETSRTVSREYHSADKSVIVSVDLGLGRFGAIVTFFRFEAEVGQSVLVALDTFVHQEIASRWQVTDCADIEDFRTPQIWD